MYNEVVWNNWFIWIVGDFGDLDLEKVLNDYLFLLLGFVIGGGVFLGFCDFLLYCNVCLDIGF